MRHDTAEPHGRGVARGLSLEDLMRDEMRPKSGSTVTCPRSSSGGCGPSWSAGAPTCSSDGVAPAPPVSLPDARRPPALVQPDERNPQPVPHPPPEHRVSDVSAGKRAAVTRSRLANRARLARASARLFLANNPVECAIGRLLDPPAADLAGVHVVFRDEVHRGSCCGSPVRAHLIAEAVLDAGLQSSLGLTAG